MVTKSNFGFVLLSVSSADLKDKLEYFEDIKCAWQALVAQRMPLACFKAGSDDIIGMHFIFVNTRNDRFNETLMNLVINMP